MLTKNKKMTITVNKEDLEYLRSVGYSISKIVQGYMKRLVLEHQEFARTQRIKELNK